MDASTAGASFPSWISGCATVNVSGTDFDPMRGVSLASSENVNVAPHRAAIILACIWTVAILAACWIPSSGLPIKEDGPAFLHIPHLDKIIHAVLFGIFGILWAWAIPGSRMAPRIIVGGLLLAIFSEIGQAMPFVKRDPGFDDVLANLAGLIPGYYAARYLLARRQRSVGVATAELASAHAPSHRG
jgi:hypothetical protein